MQYKRKLRRLRQLIPVLIIRNDGLQFILLVPFLKREKQDVTRIK